MKRSVVFFIEILFCRGYSRLVLGVFVGILDKFFVDFFDNDEEFFKLGNSNGVGVSEGSISLYFGVFLFFSI